MTFSILLFYSNATVMLFKVVAWLYTGSSSMLSESIHSFVDTANQVIYIHELFIKCIFCSLCGLEKLVIMLYRNRTLTVKQLKFVCDLYL